MFERLTYAFLTLFAAFRRLESDLAEAHAELSRARDEVQYRLAECQELQRRLDDAVGNERAALRAQVNFASQQRWGATPYPEAATLPAEALEHGPPIYSNFEHGSTIVQRRKAKFAEQYKEFVKTLHG